MLGLLPFSYDCWKNDSKYRKFNVREIRFTLVHLSIQCWLVFSRQRGYLPYQPFTSQNWYMVSLSASSVIQPSPHKSTLLLMQVLEFCSTVLLMSAPKTFSGDSQNLHSPFLFCFNKVWHTLRFPIAIQLHAFFNWSKIVTGSPMWNRIEISS